MGGVFGGCLLLTAGALSHIVLISSTIYYTRDHHIITMRILADDGKSLLKFPYVQNGRLLKSLLSVLLLLTAPCYQQQ